MSYSKKIKMQGSTAPSTATRATSSPGRLLIPLSAARQSSQLPIPAPCLSQKYTPKPVTRALPIGPFASYIMTATRLSEGISDSNGRRVVAPETQ
jgi:hypothetical protein